MGTITHIQASSQDLMVSEIVGTFLLETPPSGEFPRLKPVSETIDTFGGIHLGSQVSHGNGI